MAALEIVIMNTSVSTYASDDLSLDVFVSVVDWISVYYSLVLVVMGCICNPLSFMVLGRRAFQGSTMSIYLRFLSLFDLGAILSGATRFFMMKAFSIDLRFDTAPCKANLFFSTLFVYGSSWTLVIVTTERVVSIIWPHRVQTWCNRATAKIIIPVLICIMFPLATPFTVIYGRLRTFDPVLNVTSVNHCAKLIHGKLSTALWIFDAIIYAFLPSLILIVSNIIIVAGVIRSGNRVMRKVKTQHGATHDTSYARSKSGNVATQSFDDQVPKFRKGKTKSVTRHKKEMSLTRTLIVINTTFVICNFPVTAFGFGPHYQTPEGLGPDGDAIDNILVLLMYTNNAMNFVLYFVTGSKFRAELQSVFTTTRKTLSLCRA